MKTALDAFKECGYALNQHGNTTCARQHSSAWNECGSNWLAMQGGAKAKLKRESAMKKLIHGLALYIDSHQELFDSRVGDDGYCGDYVADIAKAIIALLSSESGRLDSGTLDHYIREMAARGGLDL